jgi:CO/xanthine dehydrogenase FAD-binding subunit
VKFDYYKVNTIAGAIEILETMGEKAKILAGGTDLLVGVKNGKFSPETIIDITPISSLSEIKDEENQIKIGAAVTHANICNTLKNMDSGFIALAEASSQLGSPQVRNLATIGGNVCNAAPSAETAPALIALNCNAIITGPSGNREMKLEDFFKGPSKNALEDFEILTDLQIERQPSASGSAYLRLSSRNALDLAVVNVGVFVKLDSSEKIESARICLGAVAPTPVRALKAENVLVGESFSDNLLEEAGRLAKMDAVPITDVRASASYRKEMVGVLTKRALKIAFERAKKE